MSDFYFHSHSNICILSSDILTALALKEIIDIDNPNTIINFTTLNEFSMERDKYQEPKIKTLILYLPKDIPEALFLLKQSVILLTNQREEIEEIIIITSYSFNWIYHTLKPLITPETLRKVRTISAKESLQNMIHLLKTPLITGDCLPIQARREEIETGVVIEGLTRNEYDCVLDFFCGRSIKEPFYSSNKTASSTRYNQRNTGLRKLLSQKSALFNR